MTHPTLDDVRVARPCPADWHAMTGTDRVRFCDDCGLNVYNLSALTAADALALVRDTEGRRCVRFYRRADGTLLTRDCPGVESDLAFARERLNGALLVLALFGFWVASGPLTDAAWSLAGSLLATVTTDGAVMGGMEMGDMELPVYTATAGEMMPLPVLDPPMVE